MYITMEYYWAKKKNETMPFVSTWMDLEIIILNAVSQKEKDVTWLSFICGIYNMTQMNLSMIWKQTHGEQAGGCWGEWGGEDELGILS